VQGVVEDGCVARRVSRHFDIICALLGTRYPQVCAAARAGKMEH
jgi:hypothetical protein